MELSSFGAFLAPSNESLLPPDAGNATAPGQEEHHHFAPLGPVPVLQIPTFALSIFYLIVTLTVIVQIVLNLYYKDRRASFNFAFSLLCLLWGVLRTMVFMVLGFWFRQPYWVRYLLYWLPVNLQFAIFSLLVLFYVSVLYKTTWQSKTRAIAASIYFITNTILLAGMIGCVVIGQLYDGEFADFLRAIFTIIVFAILSVLIGIFGYKVYRYMVENRSQTPQLHGISPRKVGIVTLLSVFIFLSRCFYQALTLILGVSFTFTNRSWEKDLVTAVCYFFWEIVSTAMIIIMFWRRGGSGNAAAGALRAFPYYNTLSTSTTNSENQDFAPGTLYSTPTSALPRVAGIRAGERESTALFPKSRGSPMLGSYYAGTSAHSYSPM